MGVIKWSSLFLAAVVALACAAPASAGAAPALTDGKGNLLGPGSLVTLSSSNATVTISGIKFSCELIVVGAEVTENTGSSVTGVGAGAGKGSVCKGLGGSAPWTDITVISLASSTPGKGTVDATLTIDIGGAPCHYAAAAGGLAFTYSAGGSSIAIANGTLKGTPAACPPGSLNATVSFERAGGSVIFD